MGRGCLRSLYSSFCSYTCQASNKLSACLSSLWTFRWNAKSGYQRCWHAKSSWSIHPLQPILHRDKRADILLLLISFTRIEETTGAEFARANQIHLDACTLIFLGFGLSCLQGWSFRIPDTAATYPPKPAEAPRLEAAPGFVTLEAGAEKTSKGLGIFATVALFNYKSWTLIDQTKMTDLHLWKPLLVCLGMAAPWCLPTQLTPWMQQARVTPWRGSEGEPRPPEHVSRPCLTTHRAKAGL